MEATIEPGRVNGIITAPSSKSHTQRAYAAALLHTGKSVIRKAGQSADEDAALNIIRQLGARVTEPAPGTLEILSSGVVPVTNHIDCGESGLAARLFTPVAGIAPHEIKIDGSGSLLHRPMAEIGRLLPDLNVRLSGFHGHLPFSVHGPMMAKNITVDGGQGSQLLSGLLFSLCHVARVPVTVAVSNLKSIPYIDLTLEVLGHFGKPLTHDNYSVFYVNPSNFTQKDIIELDIEGDWSSSAALLVAGAIAGEVTVQNLELASAQADKVLLDILSCAGAETYATDDTVTVKHSRLEAFECDLTHCPDLFPVLAILAACCDGESHISGVHRLLHKESNRAESITEMLYGFGVPYSVANDALCITGVENLAAAKIDAFNDHRIVMAAAVGALRANGPVSILHATAVNKSYPAFFRDFGKCGALIQLNN